MQHLPKILAALGLLGAFVFFRSQKQETLTVVVAAADLPAGHTLTASDLTTAPVLASGAPAAAYTDPAAVVGQTLRVARLSGDVIAAEHLGGQTLELQPDERAIGIEVTDSAGLAGLLKPGDLVGVTAVLRDSGGAYSKVIAENLRVLYVSPEFSALDPLSAQRIQAQDGNVTTSVQTSGTRDTQGTVVLAVPVKAQVVAYDFAPFGVQPESRLVNLVDLLPALDSAQNVTLSLYLQPEAARTFRSPGVYVPDLVVTPGPSPTPTPAPLSAAAPLSGTLQTTPTP